MFRAGGEDRGEPVADRSGRERDCGDAEVLGFVRGDPVADQGNEKEDEGGNEEDDGEPAHKVLQVNKPNVGAIQERMQLFQS